MADYPVLDYPQALDFLSGFEQSTIKLGLERITAFLDLLDNPERRFRSIHIAGTNGKGSVAAFLDNLLSGDDQLVGRFVSPHLLSPRERITIDGKPITRQWFCAVMSRMRDVVESGDIRPSYFELMMAAASYAFSFLKVDWGVMETGLGGRLDATNVLHPELAVITSISMDHNALLGNSLEAIAGEKAGIIKSGIPVLTRGECPGFPTIRTMAKKRSAPLVVLGRDDVQLEPLDARRTVVSLWNGRISAESPLAGTFQLENLALALAAFHTLTGKTGDMSSRLAGMNWPARLERLQTEPAVILDGAHNMDAVRVFLENVQPAPTDLLIFGCMADKQGVEMYSLLKTAFPRCVLTSGTYHRFLGREGFRANPVFEDPYVPLTEIVPEIRKSTGAYVCGSLHLVGDVLNELSGDPAFREVLLEKEPYCHLLDADPA